MEARKITITSTRSQNGAKTIMSSAETLGELKADLRAANIDYEDLTFYEGLSRTELIDDSSLLPKDINYKGNVTNNLVFMLTNPNKKIKSGADRKELYAYIKEHEDLKEAIKNAGANYTNLTTSALEQLVSRYMEISLKQEERDCEKCSKDIKIECYIAAIKQLLTELEKLLINTESEELEEQPLYSSEELDEMFDFVN